MADFCLFPVFFLAGVGEIEKASENSVSVSDSQREQQNNNSLLQLFEIEKNSWQTFRITYFFHEVYKRKL